MESQQREIEGVLGGSREAIDALFERCWAIAWPIAYTMSGNQTTAEDAAQEAVVRAFRGLKRFDRTRPFEPWFTRIAVNATLNELRRERRTKPRAVERHTHSTTETTAEESPPVSARVASAVASLSPKRRAIIVLHYWLDYRVEDIAAVLDMPSGTVASHLSRAREELRKRLEVTHV